MTPHFGYSNFEVFIINSTKAISFVTNLIFQFYLELYEAKIVCSTIHAKKFLLSVARSQAYFFLFCIFSYSNSFANKFIEKLNAVTMG
jgi:hypothetical protein